MEFKINLKGVYPAGGAANAPATSAPTPTEPNRPSPKADLWIRNQLNNVPRNGGNAAFKRPTAKHDVAARPRPENLKIIEQFMKGRAGAVNVRRVTTWGMRTSNLAASLIAVEAMREAGVEPDVSIYQALLSKCEQSNDVEEALRIFNQMRDSDMLLDDIPYATMISICERSGNVQKALDVFNEMRLRGIVPSAKTYDTLLAACLKSERHKELAYILQDMRGAGVTPSAGQASGHVGA